MDIFYRRKTHMLLVFNGVLYSTCGRWFNFLTSFTTRTSPKVLEWEHSKNTIMSAQYQRIMTTEPKASRAPGSTKQTLGQSDLYRGSAARLNHRPLTTPKSWEIELPSTRPIHEQQWFGSHVAPGNMLRINWVLENHVDTATGLKHPWFDRGCTYHYCGHILTSIFLLGVGPDNNNPEDMVGMTTSASNI